MRIMVSIILLMFDTNAIPVPWKWSGWRTTWDLTVISQECHWIGVRVTLNGRTAGRWIIWPRSVVFTWVLDMIFEIFMMVRLFCDICWRLDYFHRGWFDEPLKLPNCWLVMFIGGCCCFLLLLTCLVYCGSWYKRQPISLDQATSIIGWDIVEGAIYGTLNKFGRPNWTIAFPEHVPNAHLKPT